MKERILLVEDDLELRQNYREILEFEGFEVAVASDGNEAYGMLTYRDFDLILSDILMGSMDGYELLRSVRSDERFANTPFIFISAKSSVEDQRLGLAMGSDDYLVKPVPAKLLLSTIANSLVAKKKMENWAYSKARLLVDKERAIKMHELRTPLFGILSVLEILKEYDGELDQVERNSLLNNAFASARRIDDSLKKLSHYQNLDKCGEEVEQVADFGEVLAEALHEYPGALFKISGGPYPVILFNRERLFFVLGELVGNAYKFSPQQRPIEILLTEDGFQIRNSQNMLTKKGVVNPHPFNQINRELVEQQGLGLGVFICSEYCRASGAELSLFVDEDLTFNARITFKKH